MEKNYQIRIAGSAAIFKDDKILLLKRSEKKSKFPSYWTFPSGGIENHDKNIEDTVIREVKEETNIDFIPKNKFSFYDGIINNERYFALVYTGEWSGDIKIDQEESSEYGFFTYQEAMNLPLAFSYKEVIEDLFTNK